jgi:hypothetical protein
VTLFVKRVAFFTGPILRESLSSANVAIRHSPLKNLKNLDEIIIFFEINSEAA